MSARRLLSILVPTLESRRTQFAELAGALHRQIDAADAAELVEILYWRDAGEVPIGAKRNRLAERASGRFVVFVDDDDAVSPDYVPRILAAIRNHPDADCVTFDGEITFRGRYPRRLVHRLRHRDWYHERGRYLRPPCQIVPVRRDVVLNHPYSAINRSEDMEWALRISREGVLRNEAVIDAVLYHYRSRRHYGWQWLLDRTQRLRHALGLRWVNRPGIAHRLPPSRRSPET